MADSTLLLIFLIFAVGAAAYFAWRASQAREAAVRDRARLEGLEIIKAERDRAVAERDAAREETKTLTAELSELKGATAAREEAHRKMLADLEKNFEGLAAKALDANQQRFIAIANETFEKHKSAAQGGVKEVLAPAQEALAKLSLSVDRLQEERLKDKSAIGEQMRNIGETLATTNKTTHQLLNALRASPKARGRWGEQTLRNVLEMSGLASRIDFTEQASTQDGEGARLRPDVVINLPGGRCIVVDSKVALSGYLDAMEATDDSAREAHLKKHAAELRAHVKGLASKEYWKHVPETADFVVLFVPGENFLAAAAERDPNLFDDAFAAQVIIVTPATMVALAKSVAYGWRQEEAAKNAQAIGELGRELYRRLVTMTDHMAKVGDSIGKSVQNYNALLNSMESRVFPQARRFRELGAADAGIDPPALTAIETAPRLPAAQTELELPPPTASKKKGAA
ncbi:MAG: DNA recombination protein RmuC [Hyphomonadaceae bacterium]